MGPFWGPKFHGDPPLVMLILGKMEDMTIAANRFSMVDELNL